MLIELGNCLATAGMVTPFYALYRCVHGIPQDIFDGLIAAAGADLADNKCARCDD
jgi:hypothetical protein